MLRQEFFFFHFILFFSNVKSIANTYLSGTHITLFLQLLAHVSLHDLLRTQTSVFPPTVTLWNSDSQRNRCLWYKKPDYLYYCYRYYYILCFILCPAVSPHEHECIPPFYLPSAPFPSCAPAFASYGAKSASKGRYILFGFQSSRHLS